MLELVLRVGFSLLVVFGLMWGLAKVARRPLGGNRGTSTLSVLARQQLARGAAVTIVQVADKALILGVTDQQVSLLGETEPALFAKRPHVAEQRDTVPLMPEGVLSPPANPLTEVRRNDSIRSPRPWRRALDVLRDRTMRQ